MVNTRFVLVVSFRTKQPTSFRKKLWDFRCIYRFKNWLPWLKSHLTFFPNIKKRKSSCRWNTTLSRSPKQNFFVVFCSFAADRKSILKWKSYKNCRVKFMPLVSFRQVTAIHSSFPSAGVINKFQVLFAVGITLGLTRPQRRPNVAPTAAATGRVLGSLVSSAQFSLENSGRVQQKRVVFIRSPPTRQGRRQWWMHFGKSHLLIKCMCTIVPKPTLSMNISMISM